MLHLLTVTSLDSGSSLTHEIEQSKQPNRPKAQRGSENGPSCSSLPLLHQLPCAKLSTQRWLGSCERRHLFNERAVTAEIVSQVWCRICVG